MVDLTRELDRTKAEVFQGKGAAFLGSIMCKMDMHWDSSIPTACTDGKGMWWNPEWFLSLPKATRVTVLIHEVWHPARLHGVRMGTRDPETWNWACDIVINNALDYAGYSFEGTQPWLDHKYDGMSEEQIYDILIKDCAEAPKGGSWGEGTGDLRVNDEENSIANQINMVVSAQMQAKLSGDPGALPGEVEAIIKKFLAPVVPWEAELQEFMTDLAEECTTWARPWRRYPDMYMPDRFMDEGKLRHLAYFLDVSGSILNKDIVRFNSEVKHVFETFQPARMTLILFDTQIHRIYEFVEGDTFDEVVVCGRGGTSLHCVREYIEDNMPTAAIIFTDLEVSPMQPLSYDIPVLWVCNKAGKSVPFGRLIHIRS